MMTFVTSLALIHPHPVFRGLLFLLLVGGVAMFFVALGVMRYMRHADTTSRLKSLEEKLDRLANPPAAK